jgi:hypothetical protein
MMRGFDIGNPNRIFVLSYRRGVGSHAAVYALGNRRDAVKPGRRTKAEIWQIHKKRMKEDPAYLAAELARRTANRLPKMAVKSRRVYINGKEVNVLI